MPLPYNAKLEAMALTNQLYYRGGVPEAKPLAVTDAKLVVDAITEALTRAFIMGKGFALRDAVDDKSGTD